MVRVHRIIKSDVTDIHRTAMLYLLSFRMAVSKKLADAREVSNSVIECWQAHADNADKVLKLCLELMHATADEDSDGLKLLHRSLVSLQADLAAATRSILEE